MLAAALGLTGVSGVFRHAATMTMESMRRNRTDLQARLLITSMPALPAI